LRDDARTLADEIVRFYEKKLSHLQKLLMSESDKLHYEKIENLDRVGELIRDDTRMIEEINLIDFDISRSETSLAALIGIKPGSLYDHLSDSVAGAAGLLSIRKQVREAAERLCTQRAELSRKLASGAGRLEQSIDDLSRINRLKQPDDEDNDGPR
jgi:hypothetical protein